MHSHIDYVNIDRAIEHTHSLFYRYEYIFKWRIVFQENLDEFMQEFVLTEQILPQGKTTFE